MIKVDESITIDVICNKLQLIENYMVLLKAAAKHIDSIAKIVLEEVGLKLKNFTLEDLRACDFTSPETLVQGLNTSTIPNLEYDWEDPNGYLYRLLIVSHLTKDNDLACESYLQRIDIKNSWAGYYYDFDHHNWKLAQELEFEQFESSKKLTRKIDLVQDAVDFSSVHALPNEKSKENSAIHLLGLWTAKEQCENELYSRASYIVDMFEDKNVAVHFCHGNSDYELGYELKFYKKPAFSIFECQNWKGWYSLSCRIVRVEDETENPFPYAVQIDLIDPEDRSTYGTYTISLETFADPNWKQNIEDLLTEGKKILKLKEEELKRQEKEEEESKEYEEYLRLAQKYGARK